MLRETTINDGNTDTDAEKEAAVRQKASLLPPGRNP
jgi:hypothetical protein